MFNRFNRNMNSKVDTNIYLLIIVLLAALVCYLQPKLIFPALIVFGIIYYFSRQNIINKEIFFSSYLDNIIRNIERTNHFAVRKLDIGIAVFSKDGKLQWKNELFASWVGKKNLEGKKPEEILPLAQNAFELMSVHDGEQVIQIEDRYYRMRYYSVQTQEHRSKRDDSTSGLMLYLTDITDYELMRQKYNNDKLCLAYVRFDNYEEVMRGLSETNIANLNGEINELLTKWTASQQGFICRMNKESSLLGFSQSAVLDMMEDKFTILDKVREIRSGNKILPTVSIGVSCDGETLEELIGNANKSLYLALGRGGDQAVVMKDKNTQFFGGTSSVGAKSTRVRARIVAQTIHEQMQQADRVFVMGHTNEDYDAIGATMGMAKLSLSLGKETYIVCSELNAYYYRIAEVLDNENIILSDSETKYMDIMVHEPQALELVTNKSLLVLVDHHRAVLSASKALLEAVKNRIIIDHHRRAEDIIADTLLLYLEPSSSSASELVTELIGYFDDRLDITPAEATALYAGIVLDSKNFIDDWYFIYHDKDLDDKGELKKYHIHIFIKGKNPIPSTNIESLFGCANNFINRIDGKFYTAIQYLVHHKNPNKFQYPMAFVYCKYNDYGQRIDAIDAHNVDDVVAKYENPLSYCDYVTMHGAIINKDVVAQLCDWQNHNLACYNEFLSRYPTCKNAVMTSWSYYLDELTIKKGGSKTMNVIWLTGETGSCKTTYAKIIAYKYYEPYEVFISSGSNDLLDSYNGEKCIIFDEFRGSEFSYNDLLKLLDLNTSSKVKSRYFNKSIARCQLLLITSVKSPMQCYTAMMEKDKQKNIDSERQLYRRCSNLWYLKKTNIVGRELHCIYGLYKFKYKDGCYKSCAPFVDITADVNDWFSSHPNDEQSWINEGCTNENDDISFEDFMNKPVSHSCALSGDRLAQINAQRRKEENEKYVNGLAHESIEQITEENEMLEKVENGYYRSCEEAKEDVQKNAEANLELEDLPF